MTVVDTWSDWKTDPTLDVPPSTATPEIDKELRNIKAQVKANVIPTYFLGQPGYDDIPTALTTLGTTNPANLYFPPNNVQSITTAIVWPTNVLIEAGPYPLWTISGAGSLDLTALVTKRCYLQWWGAAPGTVSAGTDISAALLQAYESLTGATTSYYGQHEIVLTNGIWWLKTNMSFQGADTYNWPPHLVGEDQYGSVIWLDLDGSTDGITLGGTTHWMEGNWLRDLSILGGADCCRHALYISNVNHRGGAKRVNIQCGSTSSAVFMTSIENGSWDFNFGFGFSKYPLTCGSMYANLEVDAVAGVGNVYGAGTFNHFKVRKTFNGGEVYSVKLANSGGCILDAGDIETCSGGEVQSHDQNPTLLSFINLYTGGVTRVGQTFILTDATEIRNIGFVAKLNGTVGGGITCKIYDTAAGSPDSLLYTSWRTVLASDLSTTLGNFALFPTAKQTLAAGTYFASIEFTGGDASNYVAIGIDSGGTGPGNCFKYSGGTWHAQTGTLKHVINARGSIWLDACVESKIKAQHIEASWIGYQVDNCRQINIDNAWVSPSIQVTRSFDIKLGGTGSYDSIMTDPVSTIILESTRAALTKMDIMQDYGNTIYLGNITDVNNAVLANVKGNNFRNMCPNTHLDRWQADKPDGGWSKPTNFAWTIEDTLKPPQARHSAKLIYSGTGLDQNMNGPVMTGAWLDALKGRWIVFSFYIMFPAGQSWSTVAGYANITPYANPWGTSTQYNIGDGMNYGASVCVEPGVSNDSTEPTWGTPAGDYIVDGTAVWLNASTPGVSTAGKMDTSWSDGVWRRQATTRYVPVNSTGLTIGFSWVDQANGDPTTAYIALPQINYGLMPSMAPDPIDITVDTQSQIIGANHVDSDAYIPTNGSSKLINLWASVGDVCWNTGVTATTAPGWVCTTAGINGTSSVWTAMPPMNAT